MVVVLRVITGMVRAVNHPVILQQDLVLLRMPVVDIIVIGIQEVVPAAVGAVLHQVIIAKG